MTCGFFYLLLEKSVGMEFQPLYLDAQSTTQLVKYS